MASRHCTNLDEANKWFDEILEAERIDPPLKDNTEHMNDKCEAIFDHWFYKRKEVA